MLGAGAVTGGEDGWTGTDLFENGLERIVAGGLLGLNDGLEGLNDGREGENDGCDGVNEGREGENDGAGLPGLNDGPEGAIEDDLPEPMDGPGLGLDLIASRLEATSFRAELRREPACARGEVDNPISRAAAIAIGVTAALRFLVPPATNMAISFPSPAPYARP